MLRLRLLWLWQLLPLMMLLPLLLILILRWLRWREVADTLLLMLRVQLKYRLCRGPRRGGAQVLRDMRQIRCGRGYGAACATVAKGFRRR